MIEKVRDMLAGKVRWFDIIEVRGASTPISFKNCRFHSITERHNSGFGVRVNIEGKTGFSYSNDPGRLAETAERAMALSRYGDEEDFTLPAAADNSFDPFDSAIDTFDITGEVAGATETIDALCSAFPKAVIDMSVSRSDGTVRLINSSGIDVSYRSSSYAASIGATVILDDGSRIDTGESRSWLAPAPHADLRKRIIENLTAAMTVKKIPSGKVPVILAPRAFARVIGILTGGLNAKSVCKGISPFGDKRGAALFNNALTVLDDPRLAGSPHSYPFDDEGVTAAGKALVNRGTIETFITDLKHAGRLGLAPGGNGARGYSSLPFPSFSNIIIEPGGRTRDDMLRELPRCVLVEQFIGLGQSNTITGDFSGNLELAYLVENGEITGRVKDCMISDNLFSLLAGEIVLSAERERAGSVLAPFILFPAVNYTG